MRAVWYLTGMLIGEGHGRCGGASSGGSEGGWSIFCGHCEGDRHMIFHENGNALIFTVASLTGGDPGNWLSKFPVPYAFTISFY